VAVSVLDIQVNSQGAVRSLNQVGAASKATEGAVNGVRNAVTGLVGAFTAVQAIKFVFAKASEIETQTKSLEVLIGSVQKAKSIIAELQQLGAVTPFTSTELIDAAKRLNAFGVEGDKVVETTRRLADVSGATGAELQGLVTAYGQVQAKGRLQGEELLQFQERGIALQEELRKMYGMTGDEFQKALSKGRISAEAVEVAIIRLTDKGGKYANGAIAQSDTLNGKFSTLTDGVEQLARTIGTTLAPQIKNIISLAISGIEQINALFATGLKGDYSRRIAAASTQMTAGARSDALDTTAKILREIRDVPQKETIGGVQAQLEALRGVAIVLNKLNDASVLPPNTLNRVLAQNQAITTLRLNLEGYLKQLKTAQPKPTKPRETPALLPETVKPKQLSVDDLLGGDIKRRLDQARAKLETSTAQKLVGIAGQSNNQQAKRMVEFGAKYQDIQLQINAIDETLTARAGIRNQLIASATDKAQYALNFDEQSLNLKTQRKILEQQILQTASNQSALSKQQYAEEAINNANALKSLQDEQALLQGKINGNEAEVRLNQQIRDLKAQFPGLNEAEARGIAANIEVLKQQISAAEQMRQVYSDIGMTIKSGVVDAIQGAVDGTKSLGEVAANVLNNIANKILDVAVNMALFGAMSGTGTGGGLLGGLFKGGGGGGGGGLGSVASNIAQYAPLEGLALGGPVSAGTPYMVGERGPELFMPSRGGSIIPNNALGGGGTSVVVNVDASGSNVQGDQAQGRQLGVAISAAVQAELVKQKRPGGLLA
jgi:tape measure domain-containing protein